MGQEISRSTFTRQDFQRFQSQLRQETAILTEWFREGRFTPVGGIGGFEIEAWLVDRRGMPAPLNQRFLERMANPLVVPELSVFNIELNTPPLPLYGDALRRMHANLEGLWRDCQRVVAELDATVAQIEAEIGQPLPEGYVSEYVPWLKEWLAAVAAPLAAGALLFIDYGYPRRAYYHPERATGTLLCHYRHRVHDDPLLLPGLQDITASVDFTAVADAALAVGLEVAGYTTQNYFLFGCGLMELLAEEIPANPTHSTPYLEQARQVKLLTLPGEMGDRFQAIALTRNLEIPLRGFVFRDERGRL